jgi:hypothetical protein
MALVNLNGTLFPPEEARVTLFDHGLLYGDGLFETLRVEAGRFFRLEAHLERLQDGARRLSLDLPWTAEQLTAALQETISANDISEGVLRLTVTRGAGPPLPDPSLCPEPSFFITVRPWTPPGDTGDQVPQLPAVPAGQAGGAAARFRRGSADRGSVGGGSQCQQPVPGARGGAAHPVSGKWLPAGNCKGGGYRACKRCRNPRQRNENSAFMVGGSVRNFLNEQCQSRCAGPAI